MEGVSGEGVRRRSREYREETEETKVEDLTAAEVVREHIRTREAEKEVSETEEPGEVSAREVVEQIVKEVREEEKKEGEISRRLEEAIEETERMEQAERSSEEKLKEALEDLDEQTEKVEERPEVKFSSMEEIEKSYQQHEHLDKELNPETLEKCEQYMRVVNEDPEVSDEDIANREGLEEQTVKKWRTGESIGPTSYFRELERPRLEHERDVSDEALEHRIDPEDVREVTAEALEQEKLSVKELTDVVEQLHERIDNPELNSVHYAELYETDKPLMEDRLRDLAREIRTNREDIEADLNRRLGLDKIEDQELRVAVTDNRLYYWHVDNSPDRWLNVLADQKFYMSKENKLQLIDETVRHLHVRGGGETSEYYLNDLLSQLTRLENPAANRIRRYDSVYSFDGEVSHFIGDVTGKSLDEFKQIFSHMGTKEAARVSNLKFPEIHKFRMRFVAIAESDCHLDGEGRFSYYEKDIERREIAIDFFQEFGDFEVKLRKDNEIQLDLPRTFGVLAEYWGIPRGDKAIHNEGLHESVINETPEVKVYYPKEMVPEDGSISGHRVSVRRHNVLHAGKFTEKYRSEFGIEPLVDQRHIQFVIDKGTPQKEQLCYEKGEVIRLYCSDLEKLAEDRGGKYMHLARDLLHIISENKNKLIADERDHIMNSLGVAVKVQENFVQYYPRSQRLSLCSSAVTKTKNDAIRWVLIAPPNHPSKMNAAIALITSDNNRSQQIAKQIEKGGFSIDTVWEGYLN